MAVSRQQSVRSSTPRVPVPRSGPRARTYRLMLGTAIELMQAGRTPSVSEVAEASGVSRATAYRYFPSQAALVDAVVGAALGPILDWRSDSSSAEARVDDLLATSMPRIEEFEATFRAALKLSLDQWAKRRAGTLGEEVTLERGHRMELLRDAVAPLRDTLPGDAFDRLAKALSLVFGVEALVILKDLWRLEPHEADAIIKWTAGALVRAARAEDGGASGRGSAREETA